MGAQVQTVRERHIAPDVITKFSKWAEEKPKYFMEACSNVLWYASQMFPEFSVIGKTSSTLSNAKAFFGIPGAVKGTLELVGDWVNEKEKPLRDYVGSVGYIISDAIDGLKACVWSGVTSLDKNVSDVLGKIKNISAIIGLSNSVYNETQKLEKLAKIDPKNINVAVHDKAEASEIKAQWLTAETNKVWWNRERNIMGIALCFLGLTASFCFVSPWIFAGAVSASLAGKMLTHFNKQEAGFWCERFAEQVKPGELVAQGMNLA